MIERAAAIRDIPMPRGVAALPMDRRGFPVPWFVAWIDGEADFRVVGPGKLVAAVKEERCWLCGDKLGRVKASVIGPMCAINRVTSEPPCHPLCAHYAVQTCPFLVNPRARRNAKDMPEEGIPPAGLHIEGNPGLTVIWLSLAPSKPFRPPAGFDGVLFDLGRPKSVEWWMRGRWATRAECVEAIERGLPNLMRVAEEEGVQAVAELRNAAARAQRWLPT